MNKLSLIFFILLSGLLTNENTFSEKQWIRKYMVVNYDKKEKYFTFNFLFYDYNFNDLNTHAYLSYCDFGYSEDGKKVNPLMTVLTKKQQDGKEWTELALTNKRYGENIQLCGCYKPNSGCRWADDNKYINVRVVIANMEHFNGQEWVTTKRSYMCVKWYLPESIKKIKAILFHGLWMVDKGSIGNKIQERYQMNIDTSKSNRLENAYSELKSEISKNVTVTGETDAINLTEIWPGENIKVYTVSGVEVKSVVANDYVVKINLLKNHIYIVNAGQARYKVAM